VVVTAPNRTFGDKSGSPLHGLKDVSIEALKVVPPVGQLESK
jgi:hypothetical protein